MKATGGMTPAPGPVGPGDGPGGILRRAMRNLGYLVGGKSFSGILGVAYLAFAVRTLGVAAFGQLMLVYAFISTVSTLAKFQTWQPILHYGTPLLGRADMRDFKRLTIFSALLDGGSSVFGAGVAAGGVFLLGPLIGLDPAVTPSACLFGLALLFMGTGTPDGLLRLHDRFDLLLLEDNVQSGVRFVGSLLFFIIGGTLNDFLLVWFLSLAISGVVITWLGWRVTRRQVAWGGTSILLREAVISRGKSLTAPFPGIWKFVWSNNVNSSLDLVTSHISTMVVGSQIGATDAGLFRIARQIAEALAKPVKLMIPVFYPEFARLVAARDYITLRTLGRKATLISVIGATVSLIVLSVGGVWMLRLIGGMQTEGAYAAMLLLSAAALVRMGTFAYEPTLISLGKPTLALAIRIIAAVIYLPLLVVFVHLMGVNGAGAVAVLAAVLTAVMQYVAVSVWFRSALPTGCSI